MSSPRNLNSFQRVESRERVEISWVFFGHSNASLGMGSCSLVRSFADLQHVVRGNSTRAVGTGHPASVSDDPISHPQIKIAADQK
jgi:hypothetical protein